MNYSAPVNRRLVWRSLRNTFTLFPNRLMPSLSYIIFTARFGVLLEYRKYEALEPGDYNAYIDSEFIDGELIFCHAILAGETDRSAHQHVYLPSSMANDELSGPIVAVFLFRRLAQWKKRRFTYRFVFAPSTIGSLSYLSIFGSHLKERMLSGLVLTCMGGIRELSYKLSRRGDAPLDIIFKHLFKTGVLSGSIRPFTPWGGDERQYCSPGFNLPVGQAARMLYGTYPEYHTSLDTKEKMTIEALCQSVDELELAFQALEIDGYYVNRFPFGEIKLDKYGLYPDMNVRNIYSQSAIDNVHSWSAFYCA